MTRYDPNAELVAFGKIYTWDNNGDGVTDYTFMDRNLGAVINKALIENTPADSLTACGLLYQWDARIPSRRPHTPRNESDRLQPFR